MIQIKNPVRTKGAKMETSDNRPDEQDYIPKHEKIPDENSGAAPPPDIPEQPNQPVYDDFMYEPIGFGDAGLDAQALDIMDDEKKEPGNAWAITLFITLIIVALALSVFGIWHDITNSKEAVDRIVESRRVVLFQNSKPDSALESEFNRDENGRYSPEAVASMVKPSIVEIFTYGDVMRTQLIGTGSGVVLSEDGYIVTNAHVLLANGYHSIAAEDGNVYEAKIIGRDAKTDIAVIKVDGHKFSPATLGNSSEAKVGEQVMAIGNPAGLTGSVTDGIISAVDRRIKGDSTGFEMTCIQTNAQISPGNSGGALVNMYGQVIGITSSKYVSNSLEGLGFAITIDDALPIIKELIANGFIDGRFRIGIMLIDMSSYEHRATIEKDLGYKIPDDFKGIYVSEIMEDSDINNTDFKAKDFITEINGKTVSTYDEFYDTISKSYGAGDMVPATCAHISKDGDVTYYNIEFLLLEDTSGDY